MTRDARIRSFLMALVIAGMLAGAAVDTTRAQVQTPAFYWGAATVNGEPVPDGLFIVARVGGYESEPTPVKDGRYSGLMVAPPAESDLINKPVTFHLEGQIRADEVLLFFPAVVDLNFDLTFASLPLPTPTPTPTPSPVPATPTATPTPVVAPTLVYSGDIVVAGTVVPPGATLVAVIGSYVSSPALIVQDGYRNLVVDPGDPLLLGEPVVFELNGVEAKAQDTYRRGGARTTSRRDKTTQHKTSTRQDK